MLKVVLASYVNYSENHGIVALAAYLRQHAGHFLGELIFFDLNSPAALKDMKRFCPDIIGYSVISGEQNKYLEFHREFSVSCHALSVFGGPHPTFFPDFINEEGVDAIVRGEGEEAFLRVVTQYSRQKVKESLRGIPNVSVRCQREVYTTPIKTDVLDVNALPFGDRSIFYDANPVLKYSKLKTFVLSRGCPWDCAYCYNHKIKELYGPRFYRFVSPELAVSNIKKVRDQYPLEFVQFQDDVMFPNTRWLQEFSRLYRTAIGLPFNCNVRPNQVTEESVEQLKSAGCHSVNMAIEHGDYAYRKKMLRRDITDEQLIDAAGLLKANKIYLSCQSMLGLPHSDLEQELKTVQLNIAVSPDNTVVHIFQPYPGTFLGDYCIKEGLFKGDYADLLESSYDTTLIADRKLVAKLHDYLPFFVMFRLKNPHIMRMILRWPRFPFSRGLFFLYKFFKYRRAIKIHDSFCLFLRRVVMILRLGTFGRMT